MMFFVPTICFKEKKMANKYSRSLSIFDPLPENICPRNVSKCVIYRIFMNWSMVKVYIREIKAFCPNISVFIKVKVLKTCL